jgi:hypothetical protein
MEGPSPPERVAGTRRTATFHCAKNSKPSVRAMMSHGGGFQPSLAESIAEGLVREFLFRHKLSDTIAAFECERPRDERSITNCNALRKHLGVGVEKVAAKAKTLNPDESLPPTIELTVRFLLAKAATTPRAGASNESVQAPQPKPARVFTSPAVPTSPPARTTANVLSPTAPTTARPTTFSSPELSVPDSKRFQSSSTAGGSTVDVVDIEDFDDDFDDHDPTNRVAGNVFGASARVSRALPDNTSLNAVSSPRTHRATNYSGDGVKLSTSDAASLKELLFAKQGGRQPASWIQGFFFCQHRGLEYGLVQTEGGPCGVLAAVQSHVLKQLVGKTGGHPSRITREQQRNALCKGLSGAIWQARGNKASVSVVNCGTDGGVMGGVGISTVGISFDELLRSARIDSAESMEGVERLVADSLRQWEAPRGQGLCMFLLSLLISRGIAETRGDMDEAGSSLMGAYGWGD